MKRLAVFLLAAAVCLCAAGCSPRGRKNSATKIINSDLPAITAVAEKVLETGEIPEDASFPGVESIEYSAPGWVGFLTGSRDDGSSSACCGFYYAPSDQPMGYQGADMALTADGSGFSWQEKEGAQEEEGSHYYTERCQYGWFYFEMYF